MILARECRESFIIELVDLLEDRLRAELPPSGGRVVRAENSWLTFCQVAFVQNSFSTSLTCYMFPTERSYNYLRALI